MGQTALNYRGRRKTSFIDKRRPEKSREVPIPIFHTAGVAGSNPAPPTNNQTVAKYVARELGDDAAGAVTPARLYEVRKVLAAKLSGPSAIGDELSAAAKGAQRETRGLIESIDDAIDAASTGHWKP